MKLKYFGILLILCFAAPAVTHYFFLNYQKEKVREDVKWKIIAGIDKEELVLLKFSKSDINNQLIWMDSTEFVFEGKYYDIVEINSKEDSISFSCWQDNEETAYAHQMNELVLQAMEKNSANQENQKNLQSFYKSLYFIENTNFEPTTFNDSKILPHHRFKNFQSFSESPPFPPPKIS